MKLIKLNDIYIIVDDYNTKEDYDSRITKGSVFYKDEFKDICLAEYPPASKVSRPVIALASEYSDAGIKNSHNIPLIDKKQIEILLGNEVDITIKAFKELGITFIGEEDEKTYNDVMKKKENIENEIKRLKETRLEKVLRRPGVSYNDVTTFPPHGGA